MAEGMELLGGHLAAAMEQDIHARVRQLREETGVMPQLFIGTDNYGHGPTQQYMGMKDKIGARLGMAVYSCPVPTPECLKERVEWASANPGIHGIIVQLPLQNPETTDEILSTIAPEKDVDGLGPNSPFLPATPSAILELLKGNGVDYEQKRVALAGMGRLVGRPLFNHLSATGNIEVKAFDITTPELERITILNNSDVIISAMGKAVVTPELFVDMTIPRVLVDAGRAEQSGVVVGDATPGMRQQALENGWSVTPHKGGVGPLTVRTLLANTIQAAEQQTAQVQQAS